MQRKPIPIRLSDKERIKLTRLAKKAGVSLAEFLRQLLREAK